MKKVLILGAGLVARPMVRYLMDHGYNIVIASPMKGKADEMIAGNPLGSSVDWSMDDPETLQMLISGSDVTVSLLPEKYHSEIAKISLVQRKPLVTTSYVQKDMLAMDADARDAGIILLNETGLDPGLDHMSVMKIIDLIHGNAGKVEELYSFRGALPAPEAADNPMRYKFSRSPKGIIHASLNGAMFQIRGQRKSLTESEVFKKTITYNVQGLGELEVYPTSNSISYIDIYGIPEVNTIYRGTFRYKGWCQTIDGMKTLGMFDDKVRDYSGMTYSGFLSERYGTAASDLKRSIRKYLKVSEDSPVIESLEFLGFFSDEKLKYYETTPFEITSDRMVEKMMLGPNERDMVILWHIFLAAWPNGRKEVIKSSILDFGTPSGDTAISRSVSLPASICVKLILEGQVKANGVQRPVLPEIYNPVLNELKTLGIDMKEEYWQPTETLPRV